MKRSNKRKTEYENDGGREDGKGLPVGSQFNIIDPFLQFGPTHFPPSLQPDPQMAILIHCNLKRITIIGFQNWRRI
jgi:hypothetical protein